MKKDDEESKRKVFNHIKRIKENAVRRNRGQLPNESANVDPAIVSNPTSPATNDPANPNGLPTATDQSQDAAATAEANPQASNSQASAQPLVDLSTSDGTTPSAAKPAEKKSGEQEAAASASSDDNNCSICLRENTNPALCNECFHCFCFPCIQQWSEQSNQCPVCRREYSVILHNIRSESDYDQLPVQSRRRYSEFEIIVPLNNFFEMDEALTRFLQVPPPLPFPHPLQNAYLPPNPAGAMILPPPGRLGGPGDPNEEMVNLSVTNYNQLPDANGNRVIQRTFYFGEPPTTPDQGLQQLMNTPRTSMDQSGAPLGELNLTPSALQNPNLPSQQPTVVYNPSYGSEPYRSLIPPSNALDRYILPSFSTLPTPPLARNTNAARGEQPFLMLESIFEQIFNDLTRVPIEGRSQFFVGRRSFPTEVSATSMQSETAASTTNSSDSVEADVQELANSMGLARAQQPSRRNSRGRTRGRARRGRGRRGGRRRGGRGSNRGGGNRGGSRSRNGSVNRGRRSSRRK